MKVHTSKSEKPKFEKFTLHIEFESYEEAKRFKLHLNTCNQFNDDARSNLLTIIRLLETHL
jgi:NADPH-dependent 7-cyano-7-deazaguanine reductase QueF-like protein